MRNGGDAGKANTSELTTNSETSLIMIVSFTLDQRTYHMSFIYSSISSCSFS